MNQNRGYEWNLRVRQVLLAILLTCVLPAQRALADSLADLVASNLVTTPGGQSTSFGLGTTTQSGSGYTETARSALLSSDDPRVFASAAVTAFLQPGFANVVTASGIAYQMEVLGPAGSVNLSIGSADGSVLIVADATEGYPATSTSNGCCASAGGDIRIYYVNAQGQLVTLVNQAEEANGETPYSDLTFNFFSGGIDVPTNQPITVELSASTFVNYPGDSAFATVDPTFSINPNDTNASEYSLEFSSGIVAAPSGSSSGGSTTVPEASTFSTLLSGFGLGAVMLAIQRRNASRSVHHRNQCAGQICHKSLQVRLPIR